MKMFNNVMPQLPSQWPGISHNCTFTTVHAEHSVLIKHQEGNIATVTSHGLLYNQFTL